MSETRVTILANIEAAIAVNRTQIAELDRLQAHLARDARSLALARRLGLSLGPRPSRVKG
ncbi:hypothetical protein [Methylobacterium nigriterrae]|uniref:hypothetical protein n=1 Tax=Methylobacterium nigriterrae TaxID=3127512 RepID=UPI003013C66D